jgi:hypothetical protein
MAFDAVVDPGSGTITQTSPTAWDWSGSLPPFGTTEIVLTTRVDACIGRTTVQFGGGFVDVLDGCGDRAGTAATPALPVRRAVDVDSAAVTLPPKTILETAISSASYQAARISGPLDVQLTLGNPQPTTIATGTLTHRIPFGLTPAGNPPFVPPTDPAATYNAANQTISWSGPLAPGQVVRVTYRATVSPAAPCPVGLSTNGSNGSCTLTETLNLLTVATPPAPPYATVTTPTAFHTLRPGIDPALVRLSCFPAESVVNGTRAANGDLWIVQLPILRLNPDSLLLEGLPFSFLRALGFTPTDVAVDERDGTVLFAGGGSEGFLEWAELRRYDPVTKALSVVCDASRPGPGTGPGSWPAPLSEIVVERNGFVGGLAQDGRLYRIDPATCSARELTSPTLTRARALALDDDGAYLASQSTFSAPAPIVAIDPLTGSSTTVTPNLYDQLPGAKTPLASLVAAGAGDIVLGYNFNGLGRIAREPSLAGQDLVPFDYFGTALAYSLGWAGGACADADGDGARSGPGCGPGFPADCDDADPAIAPSAPEANDGRDNQCPGDAGHGEVDEVSGAVSFDPLDASRVCWPAQAGATQYELVRSTTPDFTAGCSRFTTGATCVVDAPRPPSGAGFWYLVRAQAPFAGGFGTDSAGAPRSVTCP